MNNEPSTTIIECAVDGCVQPGTRHANHEHADWYCALHGRCPRPNCNESIEYFVHIVDQGITAKGHVWSLDTWLCPCVVAGRHPAESQRAVYELKEVIELPKKTVVDYWNQSA